MLIPLAYLCTVCEYAAHTPRKIKMTQSSASPNTATKVNFSIKVLFTITALLIGLSIGQTKKAPSQKPAASPATATPPTKSTPKLSDNYAKAALFALKAIEGEAGTVTQGDDGSMMVPKHTSELIAQADVEAVTADEQNVTKTLNSIFIDKLVNNTRRKTIQLLYQTAAYGQQNSGLALQQVPDQVAKDSKVIEMDKREDACFVPLESMLRSRSVDIPTECSSLAVPEDTAKKQ